MIICELDPPKTLALEKYFAGAQALVQAGCDAITLADNSLAILRVSNLAIGAMLKERFGITPLLHMSCRDRNVLGLQSELLGNGRARDAARAAADRRSGAGGRSSGGGIGL